MADVIHATTDFATFLTDIDYGSANQRITEKLAELVEAVEEVDKVGSITIKITVKKENNVAIVSLACSANIPEHPINGSLFFFGANGCLLREDPRQLKLKNLDKPGLKTVANFPLGDPPKEG